MAEEAVLVHDIAPPHPRYTQFGQFVADIARRTQGMLAIAVNPGGKILYPGQASLDAVRAKKVPLTFVNSAFLQSVDPDLGVLNLPFTITDEMMAAPGRAEGVLRFVRHSLEPRGLKVLALVRGADTILIFPARQPRAPVDLQGLKIRVAGPGVYQDILRSLGAEPVIFPAIEMGAALKRGAMDGIVTSPGGWGKNVQDAPSATQVPGLLFYTYFLLADAAWYDALPADQRTALAEAGRTTVTEKWAEMRDDDARLVADLLASKGARQLRIPPEAAGEWKARTAPVVQKFGAARPEALARWRALAGAP